MKLVFAITIMALFLAPACLAQSGSIKLLALTENEGNETGTVADLNLNIMPGSERVFLETFPLTKMSTQISLRFAQQIACSEFDLDCSGKDFFFTISSLPGIVGGPSAGAAAAVLAAALLRGNKIREDIAMTGTINSGGVVGPVGGLSEKISAAADNGISTVIIPKGSALQETGGKSIDLVEFGRKLNISVIEAATLDEAYAHFTGKKITGKGNELEINRRYNQIMSQISRDLCGRTKEIYKSLAHLKKERNIVNISDAETDAFNYSKKAKQSFENGEFYSAGSFCFRSNILLKKELLTIKNLTGNEIEKASASIMSKVKKFSQNLGSKELETITDLQTYMAVKERLLEIEKILGKLPDDANNIKKSAEDIAYSEERLYSAARWYQFFGGKDKKFDIDQERIKQSCISKISEAEERLNYVNSVIPGSFENAKEELEAAYDLLKNREFIMCLYKASQAKASIDVVLSVMGIKKEEIDGFIELKLNVSRQALVKAQSKDIFPMISYAYYEYANSLKQMDKYASLLFAEYTLEFSNFDIYFEPKKNNSTSGADKKSFIAFLTGICLGILAVIMALPGSRFKTLQTPRKKRLRGKKR